ncbi:hypothetical protein HMPREF0045_01756 [Actinomyces graevenitzii C83]|jgi:hypothetical protein|uniref:Uncharacterized protein n=1 Tax=Actinomyces graevenitzii C83 TaxID=435830 RepID=G9PHN2_9ACTO|nr:hypothetical protein [Actinomyces graevenitzii]EHM87171.1 hypothetical protein HMPREF0045_01756 [Actinomyces graevenitzii C83]
MPASQPQAAANLAAADSDPFARIYASPNAKNIHAPASFGPAYLQPQKELQTPEKATPPPRPLWAEIIIIFLNLIMIANFTITLTLLLPTIIAPNLNTFSADNPKSVYLDNNKEYYFYIKTNIQTIADKTSCVISGPGDYQASIMEQPVDSELNIDGYYKLGRISAGKTGTYSFSCVNPNLSGSHSFAVADTTDNYYAKTQIELFLGYLMVTISAAIILLETAFTVVTVRNIWRVSKERASKERRQLQAEFPTPLPAYMPASASAGPTATASPEYRPTQL